MYKIGVQSTGVTNREDIDTGYRMIKEAGFDCVDFNFDFYLHCGIVQSGDIARINDIFDRSMEEMWADFEPHYKAAQKYGLTFEQMHAPFPMWQKGRENINEKMTRITINSMRLCARMGGRYIVVHPVTLSDEYTKAEQYAYNIEMYKTLVSVAKELDLIICLENMFIDRNSHLAEGVCSDFAEVADMIDELNAYAGEERFGFCFDVGHANILGKNLYRSVLALGKRLKTLHIHDNDGVSDLHNMPYTFSRGWNGPITDWAGFLKGLKEVGYTGVINFETFRCMDSFPEELHPSVLHLLADMGHYFAKQL
ncbi:MAG: sugar phosphate isomerase/epimerase [Lachnospiraceae bacterium]|nr:sugar phosphate isomerase/epimerase [Lachnospiraceae bacterium]